MLYGGKLNINDCFNLTKTQCLNEELTFENSNISKIKFDGKSIVVLCGNKTKDPAKASSYAIQCFNWLNKYNNKNNVTAYSIYYPSTQPLLNNFIPNPTLDYKKLAQALFGQLLYNNNKPRTADEISQNFSDITFFGHSIGGFVMNELMQNLGNMLKENNFSASDIDKIYSNIVFIGYSPFALVDAPIKSIYIAPIYDSVGSTKLVYNKMETSQDFVCSQPYFNIKEVCELRYAANPDFISHYNSLSDNADTLYFMNKNTLIATPNLLFDDGITEDHNLAGVIHYNPERPDKTRAGEITTKLFDMLFEYSVSTPRQNFSTAELYNKAIEDAKSTQEMNNSNKEL